MRRRLLIMFSRVGSRVAGSLERDRRQVRQRGDLVLRILDRQHVVVAGLRIDPVAGRDHAVRGERGDDVVDHFLLIQAELAGAGPVDVQSERWVVQVLRNVGIRDSAYRADLRGKLLAPCSNAASMSEPATCTSMGAGIPMFSTASTRPPDWK